MQIKQQAKKLFDRIKLINRYCGEDNAVKLLIIEIVEEIRNNPDPKYWEEIKKEMQKL